jgi:hypothetical protein
VHPGCEILTHYFSCLGGSSAYPTKRALRHVTPNLCVFHPVGSTTHVVCSDVSGAQNVDALFFNPGSARSRSQKKCIGTRDTELVSLHPLGCMGQVVHSSAFRA